MVCKPDNTSCRSFSPSVSRIATNCCNAVPKQFWYRSKFLLPALAVSVPRQTSGTRSTGGKCQVILASGRFRLAACNACTGSVCQFYIHCHGIGCHFWQLHRQVDFTFPRAAYLLNGFLDGFFQNCTLLAVGRTTPKNRRIDRTNFCQNIDSIRRELSSSKPVRPFMN